MSKGSPSEKKFMQELHLKFGIQRNGCPESKKILRHRVCPECDMQPVALQVGCSFASQYFFSCICPNKQMRYYNEVYSPVDKVEKMLKEIQTKNSSSYDILCIVTDEEKTRHGLIMMKPLKKNTWDRNNQPSCDNIRITAVKNAFVKIAQTREGNVEIHMQGPEMIKKKPYTRLGVGVNMVSGKEWIPGVMYMISQMEQGPLPVVLNLALRYPPQFRGHIKVVLQKKIANAEPIVLFDLDTRATIFGTGINIGAGVIMNKMYGYTGDAMAMNVDINTCMMNTMKMNNYTDFSIGFDRERMIDRENLEDCSRVSDNEINSGNCTLPTDSETQTLSLSTPSHDSSDDQLIEEKCPTLLPPLLVEPYCALCKACSFIAEAEYVEYPCKDLRIAPFFEQVTQLERLIVTNRLTNFLDSIPMHLGNCSHEVLFKANKFNGSCLHSIARQGSLPLYQRLELLFSSDRMLEYFCTIKSPSENQVPFQVALRNEKDDLVNYVFDNLLKRAVQCLPKVLRHSDWFGNTIFFDSICYEKVHVLEKILYTLELYPNSGLLSARDFRKICAKNNSINKLLESSREKSNGVCFMQHTIDWDETKKKTHERCCKGYIVAKLVISIAERL